MKENNLLILNKIKLSYFHEGIFIKKSPALKGGPKVSQITETLTSDKLKKLAQTANNQIGHYEKEKKLHTGAFNAQVEKIRNKFNELFDIQANKFKLKSGAKKIAELTEVDLKPLKETLNASLIAPLQEIEKASELDKAKEKFDKEKKKYDEKLKAYGIDNKNKESKKTSYEAIKKKALEKKYLGVKVPQKLEKAITKNLEPIIERLEPGVITVPNTTNYKTAKQYETATKKIVTALTKLEPKTLDAYLQSTELKGIFDQQKEIINTYSAIDKIFGAFKDEERSKELGVSAKLVAEIKTLKDELEENKNPNLEEILAKSKVLQTKISIAILKKQIASDPKLSELNNILKKHPNLLTRYAKGNMENISKEKKKNLKTFLKIIKGNPDEFGYINLQLESSADGHPPSPSMQKAKNKNMLDKLISLLGPPQNEKYKDDLNFQANIKYLKTIQQALKNNDQNKWNSIDSTILKSPTGPMNLLYAYGRAMDTGLEKEDGITHKLSLYNTKSTSKNEYRYAFVMNLNVDNLPEKKDTDAETDRKLKEEKENDKNQPLIDSAEAIITSLTSKTWYKAEPTAYSVRLEAIKLAKTNFIEAIEKDTPGELAGKKALIVEIQTTRGSLDDEIKAVKKIISEKDKIDSNEKPEETNRKLTETKKTATAQQKATTEALKTITLDKDSPVYKAVTDEQGTLAGLLKKTEPKEQSDKQILRNEIEESKAKLEKKLKALQAKDEAAKKPDNLGEIPKPAANEIATYAGQKYRMENGKYVLLDEDGDKEEGVKALEPEEFKIYIGQEHPSKAYMDAKTKIAGLSFVNEGGDAEFNFDDKKISKKYYVDKDNSSTITYNIGTGKKSITLTGDISKVLKKDKSYPIETLMAHGLKLEDVKPLLNKDNEIQALIDNKEYINAIEALAKTELKDFNLITSLIKKSTLDQITGNLSSEAKTKLKGKFASIIPLLDSNEANYNKLKAINEGKELAGTNLSLFAEEIGSSDEDKDKALIITLFEANLKNSKLADLYLSTAFDTANTKNIEAINVSSGNFSGDVLKYIIDLPEDDYKNINQGKKSKLNTEYERFLTENTAEREQDKTIFEKRYGASITNYDNINKIHVSRYLNAIGKSDLIANGEDIIGKFTDSDLSKFIPVFLEEGGEIDVIKAADNIENAKAILKAIKASNNASLISEYAKDLYNAIKDEDANYAESNDIDNENFQKLYKYAFNENNPIKERIRTLIGIGANLSENKYKFKGKTADETIDSCKKEAARLLYELDPNDDRLVKADLPQVKSKYIDILKKKGDNVDKDDINHIIENIKVIGPEKAVLVLNKKDLDKDLGIKLSLQLGLYGKAEAMMMGKKQGKTLMHIIEISRLPRFKKNPEERKNKCLSVWVDFQNNPKKYNDEQKLDIIEACLDAGMVEYEEINKGKVKQVKFDDNEVLDELAKKTEKKNNVDVPKEVAVRAKKIMALNELRDVEAGKDTGEKGELVAETNHYIDAKLKRGASLDEDDYKLLAKVADKVKLDDLADDDTQKKAYVMNIYRLAAQDDATEGQKKAFRELDEKTLIKLVDDSTVSKLHKKLNAENKLDNPDLTSKEGKKAYVQAVIDSGTDDKEHLKRAAGVVATAAKLNTLIGKAADKSTKIDLYLLAWKGGLKDNPGDTLEKAAKVALKEGEIKIARKKVNKALQAAGMYKASFNLMTAEHSKASFDNSERITLLSTQEVEGLNTVKLFEVIDAEKTNAKIKAAIKKIVEKESNIKHLNSTEFTVPRRSKYYKIMTKGVTADAEQTKWKKAFGITDKMTIADNFKHSWDKSTKKLTVDLLDGNTREITVNLPSHFKAHVVKGDEYLEFDEGYVEIGKDTEELYADFFGGGEEKSKYKITKSGDTVSVVAKENIIEKLSDKKALAITKKGETESTKIYYSEIEGNFEGETDDDKWGTTPDENGWVYAFHSGHRLAKKPDNSLVSIRIDNTGEWSDDFKY